MNILTGKISLLGLKQNYRAQSNLTLVDTKKMVSNNLDYVHDHVISYRYISCIRSYQTCVIIPFIYYLCISCCSIIIQKPLILLVTRRVGVLLQTPRISVLRSGAEHVMLCIPLFIFNEIWLFVTKTCWCVIRYYKYMKDFMFFS